MTVKLSIREASEIAGVNREDVRRAFVVLEYAPDLVDAVISGAKPLNEAYEEARRRKAAATSALADLLLWCPRGFCRQRETRWRGG